MSHRNDTNLDNFMRHLQEKGYHQAVAFMREVFDLKKQVPGLSLIQLGALNIQRLSITTVLQEEKELNHEEKQQSHRRRRRHHSLSPPPSYKKRSYASVTKGTLTSQQSSPAPQGSAAQGSAPKVLATQTSTSQEPVPIAPQQQNPLPPSGYHPSGYHPYYYGYPMYHTPPFVPIPQPSLVRPRAEDNPVVPKKMPKK